MVDPSKSFDTELAERILLENEILAEKLMAALNCHRDDATNALREVLRFLFLAAHNKGDLLTPSHRVDLAWHEFILCTKLYRKVCLSHFGRFIDHYPGGSPTTNHRQYHETLRCYQKTFGDMDSMYWGINEVENCGFCESS